MSRTLSSIACAISPSVTLKMNAAAALLRGQGEDIVSLCAGEPDFDTPAHICRAAMAAMESGKTRYTDASGMPSLRRAIADSLLQRRTLRYAENEIIVGNGAKQVIYEALQAILNPGEEVIVPAPYWVSYPEMIRMAGGVPVFVQALPENGFLPTADALRAAVTPRTKAILLNTPGNPTGAVWPRALLRETADIARTYDFFIISDEIYECLRYDGAEHVSPAALGEDAFRRTILISGFSKTYAMTGWRVGYAAGPREVIAAMAALQSHATGNANTIAQYAALAALQGPQDCARDMARAFAARRDCLLALLQREGLRAAFVPQGAFYLLLDVRPFIGRESGGAAIGNDVDFAQALLARGHVATVAGTPFGAPGFLRLSFAVSEEQLVLAIARIGHFTRFLARKSA